MRLCVVCFERPANKIGFLCQLCGRSYDQSQQRSVTTLSIIEWAATRARRFEQPW